MVVNELVTMILNIVAVVGGISGIVSLIILLRTICGKVIIKLEPASIDESGHINVSALIINDKREPVTIHDISAYIMTKKGTEPTYKSLFIRPVKSINLAPKSSVDRSLSFRIKHNLKEDADLNVEFRVNNNKKVFAQTKIIQLSEYRKYVEEQTDIQNSKKKI